MGEGKVDMEVQKGNQDDGDTTFEGRFGWYAVLNRLVSDDITKHDQVLSKTLVETLNQLVYIVAKEKEVQKRHKEMMMRTHS